MKRILTLIVLMFLVLTACFPIPVTGKVTTTPSPLGTETATLEPGITLTPTLPPSITTTPGNTAPFPNALACPHPDNITFHTLWNSTLGCHYDHEHGTNPFTAQVAAAFPGFNLQALLGGVQVSHTNPTSPMENTHKHGGNKWDVVLSIPCVPFEGARYCVTAAVVQYHAFGDYAVEMEVRNHSTASLIKACDPINLTDCGYLFTIQHQEYGQRVSQYQGDVLPYPDNFLPVYPSPRGPYFTIDRYGTCTGCRPSLEFVRTRNANANSIWTSKATGTGPRPETSKLFRLLFRVRDTYQLLEWASVADGYPFTFGFVCGGSTYNPALCRYNNTTTKIHEVAGDIPASWDNLAGFDTNPTVGRITAEGFTTRFGDIALDCASAGGDCFPVKLVNMFVGSYGGALPGQKVSNPDAVSNPSRNLFFCGSSVCAETSPGAVPSGWVLGNN